MSDQHAIHGQAQVPDSGIRFADEHDIAEIHVAVLLDGRVTLGVATELDQRLR